MANDTVRIANLRITFLDIDRSDIKEYDFLIGFIEIVAALCGATLNTLCLPSFISGKRTISKILYTFIILNDITICVSSLPTCLSMMYNRNRVWLENLILCNVIGFIITLTSRMSVFLVGVLSVSRTISIRFPFVRQQPRYQVMAVALGYLFNGTVVLIPFILTIFSKQNPYFYDAATGSCILNWKSYEKVVNNNSIFRITAGLFFAFLPWLIPGVLIVVSCVVSIIVIYKLGKRATEDLHSSQRDMVTASITIIIITILYVALNAPVWIYLALFLVDSPTLIYMNPLHYCIVTRVVVMTTVILNAAINPIVYVCRMRRVRCRIRHIRRKFFGKGVVSVGPLKSSQTNSGTIK